jgi:[protein-PII] uridylyltransferase
VTQDAFGLLYRIGKVLSSHDCNIEVALITTEGHRAIDVFYLTRAGAKLLPEIEKVIETDLLQALPES